MTYDRTRADVGGRASMGASSAPRPRSAPVAVGRPRERPAKSRQPGGGGLFASRASDRRLRVAGIALAAAGLLMVIFSFFTWTAASDDGLSISVTGMGTVSLEISDERAQALGGVTEATSDLDKRSNTPGMVTAGIGALLVVSGAMLLVNIFPGIGALSGAMLALVAVFMSLEYLFAPGAAVLDGTGDAGIGFAAVGLWLVTLGAFVAVAVSWFAVVVAMRRTRHPAPSRYRDLGSSAPRSNHDSRREPGHRARSASATGRTDRRSSQNHRPYPPSRAGAEVRQAATYRPAPSPRTRANQPASHDDSTARRRGL